MRTPSVSVAMATCNGEAHLREQILSLRDQTRPPDELVVCDDCSDDDTVGVLEDLADRVGFSVRWTVNPVRIGVSANFEKALSGCSGDIVMLCDQDDVWLEDKIESLVAALERTPERPVALCDQYVCDGELRHQGRTLLQNADDLGLDESYYVPGCATAFRRWWLEVCLPFPAEDIAHDTWLNRLASWPELRTVVRRPLQLYRRHGSNSSDDITSRPGRHRPWRRVRDLGGTQQVLTGWHHEIDDLQQYRRRLEDRLPVLTAHGHEAAVQTAVRRISTRRRDLAMRADLAGRPRRRRVAGAVRLLRSGVYQRFRGPLSAIRDVLR